jgi:predicted transcriptional regulator YdeE
MPRTPHRVTAMGFRAVGFAAATTSSPDSDPGPAIGDLWRRFLAEGAAERIPARVTPLLYGVYSGYAGDHLGEHTLLVGGESESTDPVEEPFRAVDVPAAEYLVFAAEGTMPDALIETWTGIWKYFEASAERRAFTVDFEIHDPRTPERVDVYIAVESL